MCDGKPPPPETLTAERLKQMRSLFDAQPAMIPDVWSRAMMRELMNDTLMRSFVDPKNPSVRNKWEAQCRARRVFIKSDIPSRLSDHQLDAVQYANSAIMRSMVDNVVLAASPYVKVSTT